jgi:REP element-mobilizing transposase RayT
MQTYETRKHAVWECKYHVVFIPKCRKKVLYGQIRRELGTVFRELSRQKQCEIHEGHLMIDHVQMLISIPPKYSVTQVMGFLKGKTVIRLCRRSLTMPRWDGWTAFSQLYRLTPLVPVIVITARPNQYRKAVELGVGAFMEKPLNIPILVRAIKRLAIKEENRHVRRITNRAFVTKLLDGTES